MRKKSVLLIFLCCILFVGCSDSSSNITKGQKYTLTKDAFIGITKSDLDDGITYIKANNNDGFQREVKDGKIFELSKGEEITVVALHGATMEIQDSHGRSGYSIVEVVK